MIFDPALLHAKFIRRLKRFSIEVELSDGTRVWAHCPNTGSMATCLSPGCSLYLSVSHNQQRKLPYTCEIAEPNPQDYVGINTHRTNALVHEAIKQGIITQLADYKHVRREVGLKDWDLSPFHRRHRLDFYLTEHPERAPLLCEVKNATLLISDRQAVRFPDAPTVRGQAHLDVLTALAGTGQAAALLFVVNRPRGKVFQPAESIDPDYAQKLRHAHASGVYIMAYRTHIEPPNSMEIQQQVDVDLS